MRFNMLKWIGVVLMASTTLAAPPPVATCDQVIVSWGAGIPPAEAPNAMALYAGSAHQTAPVVKDEFGSQVQNFSDDFAGWVRLVDVDTNLVLAEITVPPSFYGVLWTDIFANVPTGKARLGWSRPQDWITVEAMTWVRTVECGK